ncbi:MAG: FAD-dependent oxidoreductase [bacterium]
MKQAKAILLSKKMVSVDVCHLYFYTEGEGFEFSPGQYVILTVPNSPTPLKRLYSFAGSNSNKNVFELLIKLIPTGAASEYVRGLVVGDMVDVLGPAGLFVQQKTVARKIYMVTGTGFAPIRSFLTSPSQKPLNCALFWGLKDLSETYMFDELFHLKNTFSSFSFYYCLSRQPSFSTIPANLLHYFRAGHINEVWASQISKIEMEDEYYLCGSRTVIESLRVLLLSKGVAKNHLFFEKY